MRIIISLQEQLFIKKTKSLKMKNLFLFIFAIAMFASCSDTELVDTQKEDTQIELRVSCGDDLPFTDAAAIAAYAESFSSCPKEPICQNLCTAQVSDCIELEGPCVSELELRKWIRSFINSKLYCDKPSDGFCYPKVEVDHTALKEGRFVLCLSGTVWNCPELEEIPTPCSKLLENSGLSVEGQVIGLNVFRFNFTNTSNQPLTVLINGSPFVIPANTKSHVIQFPLNTSVTITYQGCELGTWNPVG